MDTLLLITLVISAVFFSLAIELLVYNFLTDKSPREFFAEITKLGAVFVIATVGLMSGAILSLINLYLPLWKN